MGEKSDRSWFIEEVGESQYKIYGGTLRRPTTYKEDGETKDVGYVTRISPYGDSDSTKVKVIFCKSF